MDKPMTVAEAGRRGGLAVLRHRGRSFFVEIGKKGQVVLVEKYPGMASRWGKMGGRPRRLTFNYKTGEKV